MRQKPKCDTMNLQWKDTPTVILAEKIKKEKWAKNITIEITPDELRWSNGNYSTPPEIIVQVCYEKYPIRILIRWESHNSRGTPTNRFQIESNYSQTEKYTSKTSKTYEGAIDKIQNILLDTISNLDVRLEEERKQKEYQDAINHKANEIQHSLGDVRLTQPRPHVLEYKAGNSYGLNIVIHNSQTTLYRLNNIRGVFTIDEIRQIIKIVGTNPRAVAERLQK